MLCLLKSTSPFKLTSTNLSRVGGNVQMLAFVLALPAYNPQTTEAPAGG